MPHLLRRPLPCLMLIVASALLASCGDSPDQPFAFAPESAPDALGPYAVGHTRFEAIDVTRDNRALPLELWYPVDPGDEVGTDPVGYPLAAGIDLASDNAFSEPAVSESAPRNLVVFSHGYGGINTASVVLMETLASHGFIVASPEHVGNSQSSSEDDFDTAAANRVPDVSFVIDALIARGDDPDDLLYQRVEPLSVGVVGHSFGGMTAIGMAAGWAGAAPDARVSAIVPISAVVVPDLQSDERSGPNAGFTPEQMGSITVPTLLLGGTADINVFIENNAIGFEQLTAAPSAYRVDISGANHTHFANVCDIGNLLIDLGIGQDSWPLIGAEALLEPYATTCSPEAFPIDEVVRLQNLFVTAFFKRYLLDDARYQQYLTQEFAMTEEAITFLAKND